MWLGLKPASYHSGSGGGRVSEDTNLKVVRWKANEPTKVWENVPQNSIRTTEGAVHTNCGKLHELERALIVGSDH